VYSVSLVLVGSMLDRKWSRVTGVGQIVPVMVCVCVWGDLDPTAAQYSAAEYDRARAAVHSMGAAAPHFAPATLQRKLCLDFTFAAVPFRCFLNDSVLSRVTPRYVGFGECLSWCQPNLICFLKMEDTGNCFLLDLVAELSFLEAHFSVFSMSWLSVLSVL
jgi:hypothetical protein